MSFLLCGGFTSVITSIGTAVVNLVCFQLPWKSAKASKFLNVLFLFITSLIAYVLSMKGQYLIREPVIDGYKNDANVFGFYTIFRTLLGAAIYHLLLSIALLGVDESDDARSILQEGLWPIKVFALIGCVTVCFYVPPQMFRGIFFWSLAGASLCTLIQALLLIDVAYEYAEYFVSKYEETYKKRYKNILIGTTVLFNLIILGGSIGLFVRYPSATDRFIVLMNFVTSSTITILSAQAWVQELNPHAGIFQSSLLGAYNFYLILSALLSRPGERSDLFTERWISTLTTLGYFLAIFFAAFSAFRTGQASHKLLITSTPGKGSEEDASPEHYSRSFFHFIFLLTALQLAILMNRWRAPELDSDARIVRIVDLNIAFWLKISTSWIIVLLYIWTLFASYFFPDREFY